MLTSGAVSTVDHIDKYAVAATLVDRVMENVSNGLNPEYALDATGHLVHMNLTPWCDPDTSIPFLQSTSQAQAILYRYFRQYSEALLDNHGPDVCAHLLGLLEQTAMDLQERIPPSRTEYQIHVLNNAPLTSMRNAICRAIAFVLLRFRDADAPVSIASAERELVGYEYMLRVSIFSRYMVSKVLESTQVQ